jgi:hypothetical protein
MRGTDFKESTFCWDVTPCILTETSNVFLYQDIDRDNMWEVNMVYTQISEQFLESEAKINEKDGGIQERWVKDKKETWKKE